MMCICGHPISSHTGTKTYPNACMVATCNCFTCRPVPVVAASNKKPWPTYSRAPTRPSFVQDLFDAVEEITGINDMLKKTIQVPIKTYRKEFDDNDVIFDYSQSNKQDYQNFTLQVWYNSINNPSNKLLTYVCEKCHEYTAIPSNSTHEMAFNLCKQHIETQHMRWGNKMAIVRAALAEKRTYIVEIQSSLMINQKNLQEALGQSGLVISVESSIDIPPRRITNRDEAVLALLHVGYRALARAHHPDMGGNANTMVLINKAKKELEEVIREVMI